LNFVNGSVQLAVIDDGQGFEKPASFTALVQRGSLGLMGIQERVWAAGGSLAIDSAPGQGTQLRVTFPANYSAARA
jgi:signal transduction histidine kinase